MIFLTYDFVCFAGIFLALYFLCSWPTARIILICVGGIAFQAYYGGLASVVPIAILAVLTYAAGRSGKREIILAAIVVCAATLIFYKYTTFLVESVLGLFLPAAGSTLLVASKSFAPAAIPLGISFFTFEFVHYLVDIHHGSKPIRRVRDFWAFALFWPTMVAGPIKRYQQFIPALHLGVSKPNSSDVMIGFMRVAVGFAKKWAADNLTGWIEFIEPQFATQTTGLKWLFLLALGMRILLDFSGYSDMAIGYARIMGIVVPENFNWPYLARSPIEFWQRWHISLSLWIRDYIYIPLGGSRLGLLRRFLNALIAMVLCGLWHGPSWNFAVWGIYHGVGLSVAALLQRLLAKEQFVAVLPVANKANASLFKDCRTAKAVTRTALQASLTVVSWSSTMIFVFIGWLLFFYPIEKAFVMMLQLFTS